ncbi:MAG: prepilin peptidase [Hungatella sp.]|nr:prepilin peptidase [Hungatella sp.]
MTIWMIPVLLAVSALGGIKSICAVRLWTGEESDGIPLWRNKTLYVFWGVWASFYGLVWLMAGKAVKPVQTADLLCTYGILAVIDKRRRIVPHKILTCFFAGQMLLGVLWRAPADLMRSCLAGGGLAILFLIAGWFSRGKVGWGDIKLLGITAITAGWEYTLNVFVLSLFLSFVYSLYLIAFQKKSLATEFPFVPFLAAAAALQMVIAAKTG